MDENSELIDQIQKLGFIIKRIGYRNQEDADLKIHNIRNWVLPEEYSLLKDTIFYYNDEKDFIHFTSLDSIFSILNSKHLRLYNLLNMDDKFELDYAKNELGFYKHDEYSKGKEYIYSFSMCSSNEILYENPLKKKHLLWKLHGNNGYGAIVRLKIINKLDDWSDYYLTRCFYDPELFSSIKQLHAITNKEDLDDLIASFIKMPIYDFENEIRLVFDLRKSGTISNYQNKRLYPIIYPDKLNKRENISYIELPLLNFFDNDDEDVFHSPPSLTLEKFEMPKISISEIILGYRYNESDLHYFKERIQFYDSSINVKLSELKQYY